MGKHLHWKIKYNYLMRYYNGESPTKLGKELEELNLVKLNSNLSGKYKDVIHRYRRQYEFSGIEGLKSKSGVNSGGRPKKRKGWQRKIWRLN